MNKEEKRNLLIGKVKEASKAGFLKRMLPSGDMISAVGKLSLLGLGLGVAGKAAEEGYDAISKPLRRRAAFNNMMSENPWLKKEDPTTVKKYFRTLHTFSPMVASDPLTAGSFMKKSLEFKDVGLQNQDLLTLVDIRKKLQESKKGGLLAEAFSPRNISGLGAGDLGIGLGKSGS